MGVGDRLKRARPPHRWSLGRRRALLIASLWPPVYLLLFVAVMAVLFFTQSDDGDSGTPAWFVALFGAHLLTMLLSFVLMGLYVWDIFQNERVQGDRRVLWLLVVFFAGFFAMPIYWFSHIRPSAAAA